MDAESFYFFHEINELREPLKIRPGGKHQVYRAANVDALFQPQNAAVSIAGEAFERQYPANSS